MVLLESPNSRLNWSSFLDGSAFEPLKDLLTNFGGMRFDLPPTSGLIRCVELSPAIYNPETYQWKSIGAWEGSFPVFQFGDGSVALVRSDGIFGRWDHEMTDSDFVRQLIDERGIKPPDDGAVFMIGGFEDFVDTLKSAIGCSGCS